MNGAPLRARAFAASLLTSVLAILGGVASASASTPGEEADTQAQDLSTLTALSQQVSDWETVDHSTYVDVAQDEGVVSSSGAEINWDSATAWRISESQAMLRLRVAGSGLDAASGVTILFDSRDQVMLGTYEIAFRQTGIESGSATLWQDGDHVRTVSASGQVAEQTNAMDGFSWTKFSRCLSNAGIPMWVISTLSILCGAVCIGTAGAGCVPCLGGAALLSGGVLGYCLGEAGLIS